MTADKVNITDLRNNLADFLDLIRFEKKEIAITRRGKVIAQLVPKFKQELDYTKAVKKAAGVFLKKNHPEWQGIDEILSWVNQSRRQAERY